LADHNQFTRVEWNDCSDGLTITMKLGQQYSYSYGDHYDHEVCAVSFLASNTDKTPKGCSIHYKKSGTDTFSQFGDACPGRYTTAEHPPFTDPKHNTLPCGDDHTSVAAEYIEIRCDGTHNRDGKAVLKDIYVYTWDVYGGGSQHSGHKKKKKW
jgi:hypothetical protein